MDYPSRSLHDIFWILRKYALNTFFMLDWVLYLGIFKLPKQFFADMIFIQTIPVKSYLFKYLTYYQPTDPFVLTEKNRFGIFILNSLRFVHIERGNKYTIQGATIPLKVKIKEHYERSFGINISPWHQYHFNAMLLDEFHEKMLYYVQANYTGKKGDIKKALLDFCDKYEIYEDDLPFRTLVKMWERERYRVTLSIIAD